MQDVDVFLRGDRDYVQGTQIIAACAKLHASAGSHFVQAEFHRRTVNRIAVRPAALPDDRPLLAKLAFQPAGETLASAFHVLEEGDAAPRRDMAMPVTVRRQPGGGQGDAPEASIWDWHGGSTFEDALNIVVQAIKAEHSARWANPEDVWLTGFRKVSLPVGIALPHEGRVELRLWRRLAGASAQQTIWQFALGGVTGMCTFSFRFGVDRS